MRSLMQPILTVVACAALLASHASAIDNLLVNGSFESGPAVPGLCVDLAGGSTAITGWSVGDFHIDSCAATVWNASHGSRSIDLDGSAGGPCNGSVSQSFATTPGQQHVVSHDLSGNPYALPLLKKLEVSVGSTVLMNSFNVGSPTTAPTPMSIAYSQRSVAFTATGGTSTLKFRSLTNLGGGATGWGARQPAVAMSALPRTPRRTQRPGLAESLRPSPAALPSHRHRTPSRAVTAPAARRSDWNSPAAVAFSSPFHAMVCCCCDCASCVCASCPCRSRACGC